MDVITAETLLWRDFDEAIRNRHYTPLHTQCEEAQELARQLSRFLDQLMVMPSLVLQWLGEHGEARNMREIRCNPFNGDVSIQLSYGDGAGGNLTCSSSAMRCISQWQGEPVVERYSSYEDEDVIFGCGYDLKNLFIAHLRRLRDEADAMRAFVTSRRENTIIP